MLGKALFAVLLALGLFAAGAGAAEDDLMAMRGDGGDGKTHVNAFQADWPSAGGMPLAEALRSEPAPGAPAGYLQWKNNCFFVPKMVIGESLDIDQPGGFGQVTPYIKVPGPAGGGYADLLADELIE